MTRIDALRDIFADVNLIVNSKISNEVQDMFNSHSSYSSEQGSSLEDMKYGLEKQLKFAKSDLRQAKKAFHAGHMTQEDLADIEYRVAEIKTELDDINKRLE